jgi:hypothetical protein
MRPRDTANIGSIAGIMLAFTRAASSIIARLTAENERSVSGSPGNVMMREPFDSVSIVAVGSFAGRGGLPERVVYS